MPAANSLVSLSSRAIGSKVMIIGLSRFLLVVRPPRCPRLASGLRFSPGQRLTRLLRFSPRARLARPERFSLSQRLTLVVRFPRCLRLAQTLRCSPQRRLTLGLAARPVGGV